MLYYVKQMKKNPVVKTEQNEQREEKEQPLTIYKGSVFWALTICYELKQNRSTQRVQASAFHLPPWLENTLQLYHLNIYHNCVCVCVLTDVRQKEVH